MKAKNNKKEGNAQPLFAGLDKKSEHIEFFGIPKSKEVRWLQYGHTHSFKDLPPKYFVILLNAYNKDKKAKQHLEKITDCQGKTIRPDVTRQVELYTYYCYGALDYSPDIIFGILQKPENYRHDTDCISLGWESKNMTINGIPLKPREIKMIDLFAQDDKDEIVAIELGISRHTLNFHKKKLYQKAGVMSKPALMIKAVFDQIVAPVWG